MEKKPENDARSVFGRLFQRRGRKGWYLRVRVGEVEKVRYAGCDLKIATRFRDDLHGRYDRENLLGEVVIDPRTFDEVKEPFLDFYWARCGSRDPSSLKTKYDVIFGWFAGRIVRDADKGLVEDFFTHLKNERKVGDTPLAIVLDDGSVLVPTRDEEGNGPGILLALIPRVGVGTVGDAGQVR